MRAIIFSTALLFITFIGASAFAEEQQGSVHNNGFSAAFIGQAPAGLAVPEERVQDVDMASKLSEIAPAAGQEEDAAALEIDLDEESAAEAASDDIQDAAAQ